MTTPATVIVVGAGPAALAAARRLSAEPAVRVVLVAPGGHSDFLAGTLAVATGDATVDHYRATVALDGVEVVPARVEALRSADDPAGPGALVDGSWLGARAVIAAPGLAVGTIGEAAHLHGFWDLEGAAAASSAISGFSRGILTIAIASPVYRCPPAPYGLALRLAARARATGSEIEVRLTTPEERPLAAIGTGVSEFLRDACVAAGVRVDYGTTLDSEALAAGELRDQTGTTLDADLALVVPPHHKHPLLAAAESVGPLVTVDASGRTSLPGIFAAGDAVAAPFPRATAPAVVSGTAAASGVLASLGLDVEVPAALPEPDCFVDRGAGDYSRIRITYPDGAPPAGAAHVVIADPEPAATGGFTAARASWLALAGAGSAADGS